MGVENYSLFGLPVIAAPRLGYDEPPSRWWTVPVIILRTIDGREVVRLRDDASREPAEYHGPFHGHLALMATTLR